MSSEDTIPTTENVDTPASSTETQYTQSNLNTIEITSEIVALNVMVSYLNIAQKRGAFAIDESAKIWECIQKFLSKKE
jgi:hypothetical protein